MPVPATTGQLKKDFNEMKIGDYIACNYKVSTSGTSGTFSNFGEVYDEIPIHGSAIPDGTFYFIKVDNGLFIADRVVQHSISWNALNTNGLIQGYEWKDGLSFNGTNSYVNIPYNSSLAPTSAITCRMDISMENWSDPKTMVMLSKFQSGGYGFTLNNITGTMDVPSSGYIGFYVRIGSNYRGVGVPLSIFKNDKQHSLMGIFDGRYIKFYVDGELKNVTDTGSVNSISYSVNNSLFFGCDVGSGSSPDPYPSYFKGNMYLTAIWNRALTDQEIIGQYNSNIFNYKEGLVGYWDFQQTFDNKLYDLISSNIGTTSNCVPIKNKKIIVIRSLAGGVAHADSNENKSLTDQGYNGWPTSNEWDKYIVNFPQELIIENSSLDDIFHWSSAYTYCRDTAANGVYNHANTVTATNVRRTMRGYLKLNTYSHVTASDSHHPHIGFRPVLEYKEG